ncbi:hypothetical protein AAE02nite_04410 [Adhaeribacter aerolatus]|uniref:Calcineurin-like phosphoesterase domain-containing protein n=1 Tax=Adhaeribacter aerolatus TaxID=670289 RepID=A0A512AT67_9BACT|nr:metallophosphoesterase [Adhaeribacter aerolatus]GEO02777.1 hypothetical protein AAE02nite_04410 [Adhaeribacter aerolatus]
MTKKLLFLYFWLLAFATRAQTPDSVLHQVYLIGNTATAAVPEASLTAFQQELSKQKNPFTVVHLGDIAANQGLGKKEKLTTDKLDLLLQLTNTNPLGNMYFVPGDKDWDNSGPDGLSDVKRLEEYLSRNLNRKQVLLPGQGCPGPEIIDIGSGLRIIALNTQWWMHPHKKPTEPDTDCKINTREDFLEELEDAIAEAGNRNILLVGHHPIISNGMYGGRMPLRKHLFPFADRNPANRVPLPILGSFYAAFRQNVGTPRDMANPDYQAFKQKMERLLKENPPVIYAAAHDYNLQLNYSEENYHLVSGSFVQQDFVGKNALSLVNEAKTGFSKLTYYTSGKVTSTFYTFTKSGLQELATKVLFTSACQPAENKQIPVNPSFGPCITALGTNPEKNNIPAAKPKSFATVIPGPEYKASGFKKFFLGELYRKSWTQPVKLPYFHLGQNPQNLSLLRTGGGLQTKTLRLQAPNKKQYVFRSVTKEPIGVVPPELRYTAITDLLQEINPTTQPYGALVASKLLDATDILHARPELYVLADDPAFGPLRDEYKNLIGFLEERPGDSEDSKTFFGESDDIKKSYRFFRQLFQDHDNRLDVQAYGRARAFDIFIGDTDRHADNWRWAEYQNGNQRLYRPIPRDRDQAFSRWEGLFFWLADREWASLSIQNFDEELGGITSLTWTARHLDRLLLTSLNKQDWLNLATYLQNKMTDQVIHEAIAQLPPEIIPTDGQEIGRRLKARRERLPQALEAYYKLLARYVDVVGSNKNEYFKVERLPDASVRVQVFEKDKTTNQEEGKPYFDRTFYKNETKEIRLYAFDGKDVVTISGEVPTSIRVRVIGGYGNDSIQDASKVRRSLRGNTLIYDNSDTKLALGPASRNRTADKPNINQYNRQAFEYNTYNPSGSLLYNKSDGLGITFGINYKRQRFRKPDYGSLYGVNFRATQFGNLQLTTDFTWRQALGNWDAGTFVDIGRNFPFYNFFGLGNNTFKNENLYDDNYYVARFSGLVSHVYLQRQFFRRSYFRIGPRYETFSSRITPGSFIEENTGPQGDLADQQLAGASAIFNLDLRDKPIFTQKGLRLYASHQSFRRLQDSKDYFGISQGFLDYYATARLGLPITLALRLGGAKNYGENLPFYKYTTLGLLQNLRGFVQNRFSGDASAYLNSELRFHIGQVNNSFLPFRYGLLTFYDQGKVWYQGEAAGGWHRGYGGGFYIAPFTERFTFSTLIQHSREENILFQFGAGFRFDN